MCACFARARTPTHLTPCSHAFLGFGRAIPTDGKLAALVSLQRIILCPVPASKPRPLGLS